MVDGKTSNEDGTSRIKHVFSNERKQYDFPGFFAQNVVIVLMFDEYGSNPMLGVLNGRLLMDKFLYGEMMLIKYEEGSDTARALGVGDPAATLMEGDELSNSLRSVLKKCMPIGSVRIEGDYKKEAAIAVAADETIALFDKKDLKDGYIYQERFRCRSQERVESAGRRAFVQRKTYRLSSHEKRSMAITNSPSNGDGLRSPATGGILLADDVAMKRYGLCVWKHSSWTSARADFVGMGCDFNENKAQKGGSISYTPRVNESNEKEPGGWNKYENRLQRRYDRGDYQWAKAEQSEPG